MQSWRSSRWHCGSTVPSGAALRRSKSDLLPGIRSTRLTLEDVEDPVDRVLAEDDGLFEGSRIARFATKLYAYAFGSTFSRIPSCHQSKLNRPLSDALTVVVPFRLRLLYDDSHNRDRASQSVCLQHDSDELVDQFVALLLECETLSDHRSACSLQPPQAPAHKTADNQV